jgi:hypothetical protein
LQPKQCKKHNFITAPLVMKGLPEFSQQQQTQYKIFANKFSHTTPAVALFYYYFAQPTP